MSLLTTVIDDKSPLISYDSTWLPGTSQDDNYAVDYYLGTFQKNSAPNGKATFSFNGTAFWIYGANRPNHGAYTVQVDSSNYPNINGSGNNLFQQSLFSTNVSQTMHTVNLINTGGSSGLYVDIDMIVWQSQVGSTSDPLNLEMVQDIDSRFQYQQSAWETTSSSSNLNLNLFTNGTGHVTDTSGASVSFIFTGMLVVPYYITCFKLTVLTGEAVTLFGTSGPSNGPYLAQMDGGHTVNYNATNLYPTNYGVVIYHADNLGPGSHQLVLTNLPAASGQYLTIDYAHLWTLAKYLIDASLIYSAYRRNCVLSSSSTTTPSATVTSCASSSMIMQNTLTPGAIAGLIVEGVLVVLAAATALLFYRRWKAALATPHTLYTPLYRSPETTTADGTGIAPSLETRSNPSSRQNNIFSQPLAAVGRSNRQLENSGVVSGPLDSQNAAPSSTRFPNAGQAPRRRPLPDALGGELPQAGGFSALHRASELPPNYDTAVRSTDV